ncbi:2-oxoglutarate dehydrogenase complex dihydrolipoyllysine-residue succinyltransferase [Telmatocola sphagniphila]|uniref:Dihydrolipoyllysine-residue succinyltransferase component of 2-oxoglutarate dehydrogenase complex n=1 Tax=Telmatocola sphagniphila TaxID=1123043 RepID=A0A8E6ET54_9BACT|nr:2-oxoglutarate dehydrogenase complex dihydrolipoyllysine-residue succinyltransferase [Telmatocola sphagniphila]QVL31984.1 2-oxoglutarate dehydrogenase complex dihydrolipoyllysine-residue succinyltransferase [Telmatocola sphagniphila]
MAIEVKVPSVGESVTEGRIARWIKPSGSAVKKDESVMELETDKATAEVPAPASGILNVLVPEGEIVAVGSVVATIDDKPTVNILPPTVTAQVPPAPKLVPAKDTPLSPAAARVAAETGVDPKTVTGTGRDGRIIKEDVVAAANKPAAPVPATPPAKQPPTTVIPPRTTTAVAQTTGDGKPREMRQKMSTIRTRIAQRLVESQQSTATLTTFNEADMTAISEIRNKYKDKYKERHNINLGFMSFFVKASIEALKAFPLVNARIDGNEIVYQNFYDIGVAVSTERGLMVPILRDADKLSFAGIEKKIVEVAVKARDGKISVDDLQGGTFTITNGGIFGSMLSTPILNPPQSAILGMHSIQKRAVVVNDQIVVRPMMYIALSYDHRIIDGREAVQFLVRIKECLENPERLMLEI